MLRLYTYVEFLRYLLFQSVPRARLLLAYCGFQCYVNAWEGQGYGFLIKKVGPHFFESPHWSFSLNVSHTDSSFFEFFPARVSSKFN